MAIRPTVRVESWPREAATLPISWLGDLKDDCTAEWAGLTLRAEQTDRKHWWWAVYAAADREIIADSHASSFVAHTEIAALEWLAQWQPSNTLEEGTREG